jgi:MoaA/NifB/PqqE/SkfB family radical SAM enzyme
MSEGQNQIARVLNTQTDAHPADENIPSFCDFLVTERCNLRCKKCRFWQNGYGLKDEITFEEARDFISSLKNWVKPGFEINLGGGETLLKDNILDLVKLSAGQGFRTAISTNATLIDEDLAKKIADSGLCRLGISLDSLDEETQDFLAGVAGSFKRLMKAVEYLKKHWKKGNINIHTVITQRNISGIKELVEWVNKEDFFTGVSFIALSQPFRSDMIDKWYLDPEYGLLWPKDFNQANAALEMLIAYKNSGYKILNPLPQLIAYKKYYKNPESFVRAHQCHFGDYTFNVNVLGLVHLCCFMQPIGSVKKNSIQDIWRSEAAVKTRAAMRNCQKSCNNILNCFFQDQQEG